MSPVFVNGAQQGLVTDTTPSTQAHDDSAVVGTDVGASHADHKHGMPAGGAAAFTMHIVPASIVVVSGDTALYVPLFKDTTGEPDRCVIVGHRILVPI